MKEMKETQSIYYAYTHTTRMRSQPRAQKH